MWLYLGYVVIGASVSEPPSSDANGTFFMCVSYVVPHILNLSNLMHVTSTYSAMFYNGLIQQFFSKSPRVIRE